MDIVVIEDWLNKSYSSSAMEIGVIKAWAVAASTYVSSLDVLMILWAFLMASGFNEFMSGSFVGLSKFYQKETALIKSVQNQP